MKFLFKLFFLLIVLIIIAGTIFLWLFDVNKYRNEIAAELSTLLNRPIQIERVEMKLSMIPTVRLVNVEVGNPSGFSAKVPFAKVGHIEMTMVLPPLLKKKIQIRDIQLKKAELNFIQEKGVNNFTFGNMAQKTPSKPTAALNTNTAVSTNSYLANLRIDTIGADDIVMNYQDNDVKEKVIVKNVLIQQLKAVSMLIEYNKIPMHFTANMDLLALSQMRNNFIFNMQLKALDITTKVSGNIGEMKAFKNILLNVDIFTENLSEVASKSGLNAPVSLPNVTFSSIMKGDLDKFNIESLKLTLGEGMDMNFRGRISQIKTNPQSNVSGTISVKENSLLSMLGVKPMTINLDMVSQKNAVDIKKLLIAADRSELSTAFKVNWNDKNVNILGNVASNFFDVHDFYESPYVPEEEAKNKPNQNKQSDKAPSESAHQKKSGTGILSKLNIQIDWNMKNIKLFEYTDDYYGVVGRTTFKNETLIINPMQVRTVVGIVNTALQVKNILDNNPQIQLTFSGDNINLDKIKELHKYVNGSTANIAGTLTTNGLDKAALLSRLNGQVEMEVTQGKIVDKWFNELPTVIGLVAKPKSFTYSKTDSESALNCAVMNVQLNNGVAHMNESVAIETSALDILLSGQVDLSKETLSVSLAPSLPQNTQNNLMNAAQLIRIEGPIDKPNMSLDTKKAIAAGIQKGIDKGIEKLMQKAGTDKANKENISATPATDSVPVTIREPLTLCEAALGHKLKGKKSFDIKPVTQPEPEKTEEDTKKKKEQLTPQEILKEQLIRSLSSAVQ